MNKTIAVLVGTLSIVTLLFAGAARSETIIAFGDSITKGTPYVEGRYGNGRRTGGYEPPLEELLAEIGRTAYVLNHGLGGENTANGMFRIDIMSKLPFKSFNKRSSTRNPLSTNTLL